MILLAAEGAGRLHLDPRTCPPADRRPPSATYARSRQCSDPHTVTPVVPAVLGSHAVVLNVEVLLRTSAVFAFDVRSLAHPTSTSPFSSRKLLGHCPGPTPSHPAARSLPSSAPAQRFALPRVPPASTRAHLVLVRMRHQHDRFVPVVHFAVGEAGLVGKDELNVIVPGNIGRGNNGKLGPVDASSKKIDRINPRGIVLRTVAPCHMPSRSMSSM